MAGERAPVFITASIVGGFGLLALWMLFGAARFESANQLRWSALTGKHNDEGLLLYEVDGGPTKRRFARLVLLDPATGAQKALRPLDYDAPFTLTDAGEVWTWDDRNRKLYSYSLSTLEPKQDPDSLARKYPALLAGISSYCHVRRPTPLLKITTQNGAHLTFSLETGEVVQGDDRCEEPSVPRTDIYSVAREPGSEREGLIVRGKPRELIGPGRWLAPQLVDVHGDSKDRTLEGDLLLTSQDRLDDKGATRLTRVRTDGNEAWRVPLDPKARLRHVYQRGDTLLLIFNPGVLCLDAKRGLVRWRR